MSEDTKKIVVIKLSDPEEKSFMRDYVVQPTLPKEKKRIISFDELSFANPEPTPTPTPVSMPKSQSCKTEPSLNLSLLAASREVNKKKQVTFQPQLQLQPTLPSKPTIRRLPVIRPTPKPKTRKQNVLQFKNEEQDGYKIGFLPSIKPEQTTPSIPSNPRSLSKMEKLLGIKVRLQGKHG